MQWTTDVLLNAAAESEVEARRAERSTDLDQQERTEKSRDVKAQIKRIGSYARFTGKTWVTRTCPSGERV